VNKVGGKAAEYCACQEFPYRVCQMSQCICHDSTFMNPTSIPQSISIEHLLLDVSKHLNKTLECLSVTEFYHKHNDCFLSLWWWWMSGMWITFKENSAIFKSNKPLKCYSIAESIFCKSRFRHSVGFHDNLTKFHTKLNEHVVLCNASHFIVQQPLLTCIQNSVLFTTDTKQLRLC